METKPRTLFQNSLIWGLITGGILILFTLLTYALNLSGNQSVGYLSFLFLIFGIIFGTLQYRNKSLGGSISYGQSLASGILIALFAGIFSGVFTYILFTYIDPVAFQTMIDSQFDKTAAELEANGMSEEQIDRALNMAKKFATPLMSTLYSIVGIAFIATLVMLIASIFIKKDDNSYDKFVQPFKNAQTTNEQNTEQTNN